MIEKTLSIKQLQKKRLSLLNQNQILANKMKIAQSKWDKLRAKRQAIGKEIGDTTSQIKAITGEI